MPGSFWAAIVFGVIALGAFIVSFFVVTETRYEKIKARRWVRVAAGASLGVAILCTIGASANTVPAKNVGVVQSFGKPTGDTTGSGLKWVAPWETVTDWDASVQTSDHLTYDRAVEVRIGNGTLAKVEVHARYEVIDTAAPEQVIANKGNFEAFKNNFFEAQLGSAVQSVFESYDPLSQIDTKTGVYTFNSAEKAKLVQVALEKIAGKDIRIISLLTPKTHHDKKTEENMQAFQAEIARNRILVQAGINADLEKANAEKLKALPDAYLDNKCLEIADEHSKEPGLCRGGTVQSVRPIS